MAYLVASQGVVVVVVVVGGQSARRPPPPDGQKVKYVPPLQFTIEQKLKDWTAVTIV
jgi:hypothetical protein